MKAKLKEIDGQKHLMFCIDYGTDDKLDGYLCLPVITSGSRDKNNSWTWNGDLLNPTLKPSIKTNKHDGTVMHCWLNDGKTQMLNDSTIPNKGKTVDLIDVSKWDWEIDNE